MLGMDIVEEEEEDIGSSERCNDGVITEWACRGKREMDGKKQGEFSMQGIDDYLLDRTPYSVQRTEEN